MSNVFEHTSYRVFLKSALDERVKRNRAFSLRSFSKNLGLSPSHLSRVLNGSKNLSLNKAGLIAQRLGLTKSETNHFHLLVQFEQAEDQNLRAELLTQIAKKAPAQRRLIALDQFKVIADWYHFGILALAKTHSFSDDPEWIAKRMGISSLEAKLALDRLKSLGYLELNSQNHLRPIENANVTTTDDIASPAIRRNHLQQIKRAERALETQDVLTREFDNLTVSMRPKNIAKAKRLIREFVDQFNHEMDSESGTELFQLNVQFFMASVPDSNRFPETTA